MTGTSIKPGRRFARPPTDQTSQAEPHRAPPLATDVDAQAQGVEATPAPTLPPPPQNKTAVIIELLGRAGGASLAELVVATNWQPHTTRAALTGLRKKGHTIARDNVVGITRYAIALPAQV